MDVWNPLPAFIASPYLLDSLVVGVDELVHVVDGGTHTFRKKKTDDAQRPQKRPGQAERGPGGGDFLQA